MKWANVTCFTDLEAEPCFPPCPASWPPSLPVVFLPYLFFTNFHSGVFSFRFAVISAQHSSRQRCWHIENRKKKKLFLSSTKVVNHNQSANPRASVSIPVDFCFCTLCIIYHRLGKTYLSSWDQLVWLSIMASDWVHLVADDRISFCLSVPEQ